MKSERLGETVTTRHGDPSGFHWHWVMLGIAHWRSFRSKRWSRYALSLWNIHHREFRIVDTENPLKITDKIPNEQYNRIYHTTSKDIILVWPWWPLRLTGVAIGTVCRLARLFKLCDDTESHPSPAVSVFWMQKTSLEARKFWKFYLFFSHVCMSLQHEKATRIKFTSTRSSYILVQIVTDTSEHCRWFFT